MLSQFDRRAEDLFRQAEWACNRPPLAAAMAAAALIACAEGRPDVDKRRALQVALGNLDAGRAVDPGAAANLFNSFTNGIRSQPSLGRKAALRAVASLAGDAAAAARTGQRRALRWAAHEIKTRLKQSMLHHIIEVHPWSRIPERRYALIDFDP